MMRMPVRVLWGVFLVVPSVVLADPYSEFRIPDHQVFNWTGDAGARFNRSGNNTTPSVTRSLLLNGDMGSNALWFSDSDRMYTEVSGSVRLDGSYFSRDDAQTFSGFAPGSPGVGLPAYTSDDERHGQITDESANVALTHESFPWRLPLGFSGRLIGSSRWSQARSNSRSVFAIPDSSRDVSERDNSSDVSQYAATVTASVLWGRVRNATSVYEAAVLEHRLREAGVLGQELPGNARQQLINLMYVRSGLGSTRDRPARELWAEIERILRDSGALADPTLSAPAVLRAMESYIGAENLLPRDGLPSSPVIRLSGVSWGLGITSRHGFTKLSSASGTFAERTVDDTVQSSTRNVFTNEGKDSSDDTIAEATLGVHKPLGHAWQVDGFAQLGLPTRAKDLGLGVVARGSASYIIADRWLGTASSSYSWLDEKRTTGPTGGDEWSWDASAQLDYFIQNQLTLSVSVRHAQSWRRGEPSGAGYGYDRATSARFGLSYRFMGQFNAPGLRLPRTYAPTASL